MSTNGSTSWIRLRLKWQTDQTRVMGKCTFAANRFSRVDSAVCGPRERRRRLRLPQEEQPVERIRQHPSEPRVGSFTLVLVGNCPESPQSSNTQAVHWSVGGTKAGVEVAVIRYWV